MPDAPATTVLGIGSKVLMPDLHPGTIEEIDPNDGMVLVRHVAWDGGPSVLATWCEDLSVLRLLPPNFARPEPSVEERAQAEAFYRRVVAAAEEL